MDKSIYYDYNRIISYNALLNMLIGERGVGKSFGAKKFIINKYNKTNEKFAYTRRYNSELQSALPSFFNKIGKKFPNQNFSYKSKKNGATFYSNDNEFGHGFTLATCQDLKSSDYDDITTIIFDEFIIEKGQKKYYLKNEVENFLGLIETLTRMRDIRVIMLANSADRMNPYFQYFNIPMPYNTDIKLFKDGMILLQYMNNQAYREEKKKTRFGKLIEGTSYAEYAIENKWKDDNPNFIEKKSNKARFAFAFKYKDFILGIWNDWNGGRAYVSFDYDPNSYYIYAITLDDHSENTMLINSHKKFTQWKNFLENYQLGCVRFENEKVASIMNEIFKLILK